MAKVLLYCLDVVGKSMAGPAIRYWEFSKVLSTHHEVILATPNTPNIASDNIVIRHHKEGLKSLLTGVDVVITQQVSFFMAFYAKKIGVKIILDAYDPMPLEALEIFKFESPHLRSAKNERMVNALSFSFKHANSVICANSKQRDLWMGFLLSLGKITPKIYDADHSLNHLIDIVPFGLSSIPPIKNARGFREQFNLKESDKILIWGGGIWNWFDPLTLIKAIGLLAKKRSDIHLIFMGIKHPNENIPEMKMSADAIKLAKELQVIDKNVHFNYSWIPYEQRQNFLLEADIGISTHFKHLETQYAFRTRILDYLWVDLPMICTEGDSFAELINQQHLGIAVPFEDSLALANAIENLLDNPTQMELIRQNIKRIKKQFYWSTVVNPIEKMISILINEPKKSFSLNEYMKFYQSISLLYTKRTFFTLALNKIGRMIKASSQSFKQKIRNYIPHAILKLLKVSPSS